MATCSLLPVHVGSLPALDHTTTRRKRPHRLGKEQLASVRPIRAVPVLIGFLIGVQLSWSSPTSAWTLNDRPKCVGCPATTDARSPHPPHVSPLLAGVEEP